MKILSENGFKNFKGVINQGISENILLFEFDDGTYIKATEDHKFLVGNTFVTAGILDIGFKLNNKTIKNISSINESEVVYDVYDVEDNNTYYSNGVISHNCSIVMIDEMGFIDSAEEFYTSTYPVISSGESTQVLICSTPNGMNLFYKIFTEAQKGLNKFIALKFDWRAVPTRTEKWKEDTIRNTSEKQFNQEFEIQFAGSSNTLITGKKLEQLTYINPVETTGKLKIYKYPIAGNSYVAVTDIGEGINKDYSVITIIDITAIPYEVVAVYRNNEITPYELTKEVFILATKYNQSYLIIENNSIGKIVADSIFNEYEYENLIEDSSAGTFRHGIRTTSKTKSIGCSSLKTLIENDLIILNDFELVSEIFSFVKKNSSYQAENNSKHDDIVMTLVLFAWFIQEEQFQEYSEDSIKYKIKDISKQEDDYVLGFMGNDLEDF